MVYTANDLIFVELDHSTPQWSVRLHTEDGREVAIVTERWVGKPPYRINWLQDNIQLDCEDEDEVIEQIIARLSN